MVVEALEDEVRRGRGEGLAEAPKENVAYRVIEARADFEEGEKLCRGEGLEDYGEDLASLGVRWVVGQGRADLVGEGGEGARGVLCFRHGGAYTVWVGKSEVS